MARTHDSIWIRPVARFFRSKKPADRLPTTHASFGVRPVLLDDDQRELLSMIERTVGERFLVLPNVAASTFLTVANASSNLSEAALLSRTKVKFLICERRETKPVGAILDGLSDQPDPAGHLLFQVCRQAEFPLLIVCTDEKPSAAQQPPAEIIGRWLKTSFREQSTDRRIDSAHASGS